MSSDKCKDDVAIYGLQPTNYVYVKKGYAKCPHNYVIIYTNEREAMDIAGFFTQGGTDVVRVGDTIIITHHEICIHIVGEDNEHG